jgi:hypothetical protein
LGGNVLDALGLDVYGLGGAAPVRLLQPLLLSPPTARVSGDASAAVQGTDDDVQVAGVGSDSVLLLRRLGRGTIWALSDPALLDNAHIAAAGNRELALNLAGHRGSSILFDQFTPPAAAVSTGNWLTSTAWGVALLFLIAVLVLYRWLAGWRLGPAVTPLRLQYRPAAEYVVSLAGLLRRGRSRAEVLGIYQESLRRLLRRRYGEIEGAPFGPTRLGELEALLRPGGSPSENELVRRAAAIVEVEEEVGGES